MTLYGADEETGPGRGRPAPEGGRRRGSYKLRMNELERTKLEAIRLRWERRLSPHGLDTSDVLRFALEIADAIDTDREPQIPYGLLSRVLVHVPDAPAAPVPAAPAVEPRPRPEKPKKEPKPPKPKEEPVKQAAIVRTEPTVSVPKRLPEETQTRQEVASSTLSEKQCRELALRIKAVWDSIREYEVLTDRYLGLKAGSKARSDLFPAVRLARHVLADAIVSINRFRAATFPQHSPIPDIADIFEGGALPLPHSSMRPILREWASEHCKPYLRGVLAGLIV